MHPPTEIDGAQVLEWAWSELPFGEVSDTEGGNAIPIHGLAVCQYEGDSEVYRFSCDLHWETVQDEMYESVEQAKAELPDQYRQVSAIWRKG